ncbi:MAG: HEPN domain-containing protein [Bacilli bacterium]|nr:HEPN domain-containing protein [Bacilli bacterium]MBQ8218600.1 HEPN domain-containing protein [Bacilli bacterium]
MAKSHKKKPVHKSNEDIRNEGIALIKNALKARKMCGPLLDSYFGESADTSDVNWACYLMQQSIELALKGLIKYYYEDFREGHFVRFNAKKLEELSAANAELREISDILSDLQTGVAVTLIKWESISRYKDIIASKSQIEKVDELSENLMLFLRRHDYIE